jgi:hypothetical protein
MATININWSTVDNKNRDNIKATKDGAAVKFIAMKGLVLVGAGHNKEYVDFVNSDDAAGLRCEGSIVVDKGSILDKGELTVKGAKNRHEFETTLKRITKKKIKHV